MTDATSLPQKFYLENFIHASFELANKSQSSGEKTLIIHMIFSVSSLTLHCLKRSFNKGLMLTLATSAKITLRGV